MTADSLLPPNRSNLELAVEQTMDRPLTHDGIATLWDHATCPVAWLPWLAWAYSVDEWDDEWSEDRRREVIATAIAIHRMKGTPEAIRVALASVGQPDATIVERADYVRRDGSVIRDGLHRRRGVAGWATYRVVLTRPVTIDQAYQIKRLLLAAQRASVHLVGITYAQSAIRRNGQAMRNGAYARGAVNTQIN